MGAGNEVGRKQTLRVYRRLPSASRVYMRCIVENIRRGLYGSLLVLHGGKLKQRVYENSSVEWRLRNEVHRDPLTQSRWLSYSTSDSRVQSTSHDFLHQFMNHER